MTGSHLFGLLLLAFVVGVLVDAKRRADRNRADFDRWANHHHRTRNRN